MRRYIAFSAAVLILFSFASAQTATPARLRDLSAHEYLAALEYVIETVRFPQISDRREDNFEYMFETMPNLYHLIEWEFNLRYGDTAGWDTLLDFYRMMDGEVSSFAHAIPYLYPDIWYLRILRQWLKENPTDFSRQSRITFGGITIDVERFDADNGTIAYLLDMRDDSETFHQYLLASPDEDSTGYSVSALPIPYGSRKFSPSQVEWSGPHRGETGDFNADGLMEFTFYTYAMVPSSSSSATIKSVYLLGWKNGTLTWLLAQENEAGQIEPSFAPNTYAELLEPRFENIDGDSALEWIVTEIFEDNWRCRWQIETRYDWDDRYYLKQTPVEIWPESAGCAMRDAHAAMHEKDYSRAAQQYQIAIIRYGAVEPADDIARQFAAYAKERLVIAYALAGDMDNALTLLDTLQGELFEGETLATAMQTAARQNPSAEALCIAAYDLMAFITQDYRVRLPRYRNAPILGRTDDLFYGVYRFESWPAEAVSCDSTLFAPPTPTPQPTMTAQPPPTIIPQDRPPYSSDTAILYSLFNDAQYVQAAELASTILAQTSPADRSKTMYMYAIALELAGEFTLASNAYTALASDESAFPFNLIAAMHIAD